MKIEVKHEGDITIILVNGDIDCFTVPELKVVVKRQLDNELRNMVIDLADVPYIDSSAIGFFINTDREMQGKGHRLGLVNVSKETMQLLEVTYVDQMLEIYSTYNDFMILKNKDSTG